MAYIIVLLYFFQGLGGGLGGLGGVIGQRYGLLRRGELLLRHTGGYLLGHDRQLCVILGIYRPGLRVHVLLRGQQLDILLCL